MSGTTLFDAADEARAEGMARAAAGAPPSWADTAYRFVADYARTHDTVFCDDLWDAGLEQPPEMRALGPLFNRLARDGVIAKTNTWRKSVRSNLTEKPVWRSLRYAGGTPAAVPAAGCTTSLDGVVFAFTLLHADEWRTQRTAERQCGKASYAFAQFAREHGYTDVQIVDGWAELECADCGLVDAGHTVVRIGEHIYDWTARQFYPGAPVPLVVPYDQWRRGWARIEHAPSERIRHGPRRVLEGTGEYLDG